MKHVFLIYFAMILTVSAETAVRLPRDAFFSEKFAEAKDQAIKQGKAIIYVETNSDMITSRGHAATEIVYSTFEDEVIFVVRDRTLAQCPQLGELGAAVQETVNKVGNTTPRVTVVEPKELKFIAGLDFHVILKERKWKEEIREKIAAVMKPAQAAKASAPTLQDWTNVDGKKIRAMLIEKKDQSIVLELESGKKVEYPIEKLSKESKLLLDTP